MLNINFVPDDYVQSNESRRTNLMYLMLFAVVMAALGGSFATIKIRQRSLNNKEKFVNAKMARTQEDIKQFEELQIKRKAMMKTALTTTELLEPVPRSVLLASLTNNLPTGTSLSQLKLVQKEPKRKREAAATNKYKTIQTQKEKTAQPKISREKLLETHIEIEGIAPTDRQVATYIERLGNSILLDNVALVESKENKIEDTAFRQFKLTAMLKKDIHLNKENIERIRAKYEDAVSNNF